MKKGLLLLAVLLLSLQSFADHVMGGEITWTCAGNGKYVFQVVVYRDCSEDSLQLSTINLNWNGPGVIACSKVGYQFISPVCHQSTAAISCDTTIHYSPVERHVFQSDTISMPLAITPSGYHFYTNLTDRPSTDNINSSSGHMLRAYMYPTYINGIIQSRANCNDASPQFEEFPRYAFNIDTQSVFLDGYELDSQDSVSFSWANSWVSGTSFPGSSVGYIAGYTANQPLPGASINPANSGAVLDPTGYLNFKSVTNGRFTTCYKVESWRDGYKVAEVYRDFEIQVKTDPGTPGICPTGGNTPPNIFLDTLSGYAQLNPVLINGRLQHYEIDVLAGDSVSFDITISDFDFNSNCVPQSIKAHVSGSSMSASNLGTGDCNGSPCANLLSLNSGGGYVDVLTNETRFFWRTDTNHAYGPNGRGEHWFTIKGTDDYCVLPGERQVKVKVNVHRPIYIANSNLKICSGDTAIAQVLGDTSNLSWSPSTDISCTSCASPKLYPALTTMYTVTDVNSGYSESVLVEANTQQAAPQLSQNGSTLTLTNAGLYDTIHWQRGHAPLTVSNNTYDAWLSGEYWVEVANGACIQQTDTIDQMNSSNMSSTTISGGVFDSTRVENASYTMSISLNKEAYYDLDVIYVELYENSPNADYSTLDCRITDQIQGVVFSTDSVKRIDTDIVAFYGSGRMVGAEDYFLEISTSSWFETPTYRPTTWPVVANDGRVLTYNCLKKELNKPAQSFFAYLFYYVGLKYGIGIGEQASIEVNIFPNPSQGKLVVEAAEPLYGELYSLLGELIHEAAFVSGENRVSTLNYKAGTYLLRLTNDKGEQRVERIVITK